MWQIRLAQDVAATLQSVMNIQILFIRCGEFID
jgi:hypothetical protein